MGSSRIRSRRSEAEAAEAAGMTPEHLDIITDSAAAKAAKFATYDKVSIRDIMMQNLSIFDCWIVWDTDPVTATPLMTKLKAGATIDIANVQYTHFSVLRIGNDNVNVRVTGIG